MKKDEFKKLKKELLEIADYIQNSKQPAYTQENSDVLHNFKRIGEDMGITTMQAWGTYFGKHIASINTFCKNPSAPQAEELDGRFADAMNYLILGYALMKERGVALLPSEIQMSDGSTIDELDAAEPAVEASMEWVENRTDETNR